MKQAIQEGFILDVLKYYTPIASYYKLMKTVQDDPMFDKKRAQKKLRSFVESDSYTIAQKAEMMVEHFHEQVISKGKIGGQARAMVVSSSIPRCIEYYYAINKCLANRHSPYKAIVAFSGEHKYQGQEPALTVRTTEDPSMLGPVFEKVGANQIIRINITKIGASLVIRITISENWCKCVKL